ncbi:MAG TPA: hypothetical protein VJ719_11750 [Chthoniobacterales bacterium]|nr:hypothetical protein [Chthoniobacterales bacterium]
MPLAIKSAAGVSVSALVLVSLGTSSFVTATESPSPAPSTKTVYPPLPTREEEQKKGYEPYRQLTLDDFPLNDESKSEAGFAFQTFVRYYYHTWTTMPRYQTVYVYVMDWTVYSGLNTNLTWRRSKSREIKNALPFFQAILDINEIQARRLASLQPGELPRGSGKTVAEATRDLEFRLNEIYSAHLREAQREAEALAAATKYGQEKKKLREASAEIRKRLNALAPPGSPATAVQPAASPAVNPPTASAPNPSSSP